VWCELKRNLRIQIDKYLERIASGGGEGVTGKSGEKAREKREKMVKMAARRQRQ